MVGGFFSFCDALDVIWTGGCWRSSARFDRGCYFLGGGAVLRNKQLDKVVKKYGIIYCDPPWRYEDGTPPPNRRIENHYSTMSLEDICGLKVPSADNSVLYMWATAPKLAEAMEVMKSWGFGTEHVPFGIKK